MSKVPIKTREDLALAYTPGVAEYEKKSKKIKTCPLERVLPRDMVAIVSDGAYRVLAWRYGTQEAAMPVMEGKAGTVLKPFWQCGCCTYIYGQVKDPAKFIETVHFLAARLSGMNLEDISSPKCYDIKYKVKKKICRISLFSMTISTVLQLPYSSSVSVLRFVKKDMKTAKFVVNGCGAAGFCAISSIYAAWY